MKIFNNFIYLQIDEIKQGFIDSAETLIKDKFLEYGDFIFGLLLASAIFMIYHRFIAFRNIKKSYEIRINDKEEVIKTLKKLVYERLDKLDPAKISNNSLFQKIKNSFNIK